MSDLSRDKLHRLRNDLLAVDGVAGLAYDRLYVRTAPGTATPDASEVRNAIAHAISTITLLYVPSADRTAFRQLTQAELQGGRFSDGGAVLRFDDGRPSISGLCMQSSLVREVISELSNLRSALDELTSRYNGSKP
jgi:hypothetical protein